MKRRRLLSRVLILLAVTLAVTTPQAATSQARADEPALRDIAFASGPDNIQQRAMFYAPKSETPVPLIVALHTWSGDYTQQYHKAIGEWCLKNGWAYIHPNFRGPNWKPEATGSPLVIADVVSAVDYVKKTANIDAESIYLVGVSGGGYTSLLMAGQHPDIWAGVSVWVPIYDLTAWYEQGQYQEDMVKSCGGKPGDSPEVDEQYRLRSPRTYLANAKGVRLHINAGIRDGHEGSVPVSHSLLAFNKVADEKDHVTAEEIKHFVEKIAVPKHLQGDFANPTDEANATYGEKQPLFRRESGNASVTIFDGGHELVPDAAIAWFLSLEAAKKAAK